VKDAASGRRPPEQGKLWADGRGMLSGKDPVLWTAWLCGGSGKPGHYRRREVITRQTLLVACSVTLSVVIAGCALGAQSSWPRPYGSITKADAHRVAKAEPSRLGRPLHWRVLEPPAGRYVVIGRFVPWCPDHPKPKPRIQWVRREAKGTKIVLTALLVHSAPLGCPGVETMVSTTVFFNDPIRNRTLYDGSVHPPEQRWPR
jgi:hypothetical protein